MIIHYYFTMTVMFVIYKGAGVVALTLFDLRRRGKVGRLGLCGVNGKKVSVLLFLISFLGAKV